MNFGRLVNFESLKENNVNIEPEIIAAGWRNFFQIREEAYYQEVYQFWKNAQFVDDTIVSSVDEISIIVTEELLAKVTECPSAGEQLSSKARWMTKLNLNEEEVNRQLYGYNDPSERKTSSLVPKARVLFTILFSCILPRTGSRHLVTTLDEQCIFHLLNRHPIDLPYLIFRYMVKAMKDTNNQPYGMLLTRVFRECGIRLDWGNRVKWPVRSYIDTTTVAKMGLRTDSEKKARTKGERAVKKSSAKNSKSQVEETKPITVVTSGWSEETTTEKNSSEKEGSSLPIIEEGALKRKAETLLSDIPKQTRRSRRVRTIRQKEEKQSRELNQV